ncbi:MAG: cytidylyltransferase domain-containing protein, partial [Nitrospirales bacterium]
DQQGRALYFSRAPIPHTRNGGPGEPPKELFYLHLGVYIYLRETLLRFAELPSGVLEKAEQLEQLRALEHGIPIRVWETAHQSLRIDTPEDLEAAQRQWDRWVVS